MAITKYDDIIKAMTTSGKLQNTFFWSSGTLETTSAPMSKFFLDGFPGIGAAPSTNRSCTKDTAGAVFIGNPTGENAYYVGCSFAGLTNSASCMMIDRLCDTTGLSGTVATAQTTNLPTPALTRYTTGEGVLIGLQCWSPTGTTSVNVTCSYTNQAGTSGRTSVSTTFWTGGFGGGTLAPTAGQIQALPFQGQDYGCRAVASVTLSASTLTAGNFGVVLFKPIAVFDNLSVYGSNFDFVLNGCMEQKVDDACIDFLFTSGTATTKPYGNVNVLYA